MVDRRRMRLLRKLGRHVRSNDPGRLHYAVARLTELEEREGPLTPAERNLLSQARRRLGAR